MLHFKPCIHLLSLVLFQSCQNPTCSLKKTHLTPPPPLPLPLRPLRLWWQPDTPTARPSPSSNPGSATCFSAPPSPGRKMTTTTTLPPLRPRPSKPRRSWAKAHAGGRWRKLSSGDTPAPANPTLHRDGVSPPFLFQGTRSFFPHFHREKTLSIRGAFCIFPQDNNDSVNMQTKTTNIANIWSTQPGNSTICFFARDRLCSTLCDDAVKIHAGHLLLCYRVSGFIFSPQNLIYVEKKTEEIKDQTRNPLCFLQ